MFSHPKITPLFPHTIHLNSFSSHQSFLCKNLKSPFALHLNSFSNKPPAHPQHHIKHQKRFIQIFKRLKSPKKIHQNDYVISQLKLPFSKIFYIMKRAQRLQVLDLQDDLTGSKQMPVRLDFWLKYTRSLRKINCQFAPQTFIVKISICFMKIFFKRFRRWICNHTALTSLRIKLPKCSSDTFRSLLEYQKYPRSLKNFTIYQQKAEDPKFSSYDRVVSAFSRLSNLESLTLSGSCLLNVVQALLKQIPALLNIKTLNVQVDEGNFLGPMFDLSHCQALRNLKHLKVSRIDERRNLSLLENCPQLESLSIKGAIGIEGLKLISQFLRKLENSLKTLKIDIAHAYEAETEGEIKRLFSAASELKELTGFKFKVKNTAPLLGRGKVMISSTIMENLEGIFTRPIKLKSFEWELPRIFGPGILMDFIRLLDGSALTLKKVKIDHATIEMERSHELTLWNFLKRLRNIEKIYIVGMKIMNENFWARLVEILRSLKGLKSVGWGYMMKDFKEEWFVREFVKLAQKKGLEEIEIESLEADVEEGYEGSVGLKEILKVNPAFVKVSDNIRGLLNITGDE